MNLKKLLKREEKGQGLVEYALILVLVAIVVIAILLVLGPQVGSVFSNVVANFNRVTGGGSGVISGVSVFKAGSSVHITVTVSQPTQVSINVTSGGSSPDPQMCTGSCAFNIPSAGTSGSGTVTAAAGGQRTFSWGP